MSSTFLKFFTILWHKASELAKKFLGKHVRVEAEYDELASTYGLSGICTQVDEKNEEIQIICENNAITVNMNAAELRTERQCSG